MVRGNEVLYEVQWKGLSAELGLNHVSWTHNQLDPGCDDPKQNTFENLAKLKKLDVVGLAKASGCCYLSKKEDQHETTKTRWVLL